MKIEMSGKEKNTIKTALVAAALLVGFSFVQASWVDNSSAPTANNALAPINIGASSQTKSGGLSLGSLLTTGGAAITGSLGVGTASPSAKLDVTGGYIRALDNNTNVPPTTGTGLELVTTGGNSYIQAYNRNSAAYIPLNFGASNVSFNSNIQTTGAVQATGGFTAGTVGGLYAGSGQLYLVGGANGVNVNNVIGSTWGQINASDFCINGGTQCLSNASTGSSRKPTLDTSTTGGVHGAFNGSPTSSADMCVLSNITVTGTKDQSGTCQVTGSMNNWTVTSPAGGTGVSGCRMTCFNF